jgi:hypothetical protein
MRQRAPATNMGRLLLQTSTSVAAGFALLMEAGLRWEVSEEVGQPRRGGRLTWAFVCNFFCCAGLAIRIAPLAASGAGHGGDRGGDGGSLPPCCAARLALYCIADL